MPLNADVLTGVALAVTGSCLQFSGMALKVAKHRGDEDAAAELDPIQPNARPFRAVCGCIFIIVGFSCELLSYVFLSVSSLFALSACGVVASVVVSSRLDRSKVIWRDLTASVTVLCGASCVFIFSPKTSIPMTVSQFTNQFSLSSSVSGVVYVLSVLVATWVAMLVRGIPWEPARVRYVEAVAPGILGGWVTVSLKGLGSMIQQSVGSWIDLVHWLPLFLVFVVFVTVSVQHYLLRDAIQSHDQISLQYIYFCFHYVSSIIGGAVIYGDWSKLSVAAVAFLCLGHFVVVSGVMFAVTGRSFRLANSAYTRLSRIENDGFAVTGRAPRRRKHMESVGSSVHLEVRPDAMDATGMGYQDETAEPASVRDLSTAEPRPVSASSSLSIAPLDPPKEVPIEGNFSIAPPVHNNATSASVIPWKLAAPPSKKPVPPIADGQLEAELDALLSFPSGPSKLPTKQNHTVTHRPDVNMMERSASGTLFAAKPSLKFDDIENDDDILDGITDL
eukprot:GILJ01007215.1.p1 GENE.GILJ01007215.1~~GILJ01007215.1.p1  ORF type:complete len:504 (-),score=47.76 GILJ01007215.1:290-1801(-)